MSFFYIASYQGLGDYGSPQLPILCSNVYFLVPLSLPVMSSIYTKSLRRLLIVSSGTSCLQYALWMSVFFFHNESSDTVSHSLSFLLIYLLIVFVSSSFLNVFSRFSCCYYHPSQRNLFPNLHFYFPPLYLFNAIFYSNPFLYFLTACWHLHILSQ